MIFIANRQGTIEHVIDEPVYQSSTGASRVVLIAPFENVMATVAFRLPNGILTTVHFAQPNMVETNLGGEILDKDGRKYNAWVYLLGQDITAYAGVVGVQFFLYKSENEILATYTTQFNIQKGVVPQMPSAKPSQDIYNEILDYLVSINERINQFTLIETVDTLPTNPEKIVIYRLQKDDNGVKSSEYWIFNPDDKTSWQQINASILNVNPDGATNKNMLYLYDGNLSFINEDGSIVVIAGKDMGDHSKLYNRDMSDQHPIEAITDLKGKLDSFQTGITENGTAITASNARITALENGQNNKLDKVTTTGATQVYTKDTNGAQTMTDIGMSGGLAQYDNDGHLEVNSPTNNTHAVNKGDMDNADTIVLNEAKAYADTKHTLVEVTIAEANAKQLTADNLAKIKANPYACVIAYEATQSIFQVGKVLTQSVSYESFSFTKAMQTGVEMINAEEMKIDLTTGKFELFQLPLQKLEEIVKTTQSGTMSIDEQNLIKTNFYLVVVRIPYTSAAGVKTTLDFHPMEIKGNEYNFACIAVDNPEPNKSTMFEMTVDMANGNYSTTDMVVESTVTLRNDLATKAEVTAQIANINAIQIWNKSTVNQGVIEATEATVQQVCTDYIVTNVGRQPQSKDGLIITLTDQANDKVQYVYTAASNEWIDTGRASGSADLSAYYTKTEADGKFATIAQVPTKTSQLTADSGWIKNEANAYNYNNLANKPTIPAAQVPANWDATVGVEQILNKPTKVSDFDNDRGFISETKADGKYVAKSTLKNSLYGVGETQDQQQIEFDYAKTNGTIPRRNAQGNFEVSTPTADNETANKGYVDEVKTYANNTFVKTNDIPLATADKVGGIKAQPATADDVQPVRINANGELVTKLGGGGSGGVTEHNLLTNRDLADQHPITAITDLKAKLDSLQTGVTENGTAISGVSAKATTNENNIKNKRDKITNSKKLYATDMNGAQSEMAYADSPTTNAVAVYNNNARLTTNNPAGSNDCTNKIYVDVADTNNLNASKTYTNEQINAKLGATFKPVGSIAFSALPQTPSAALLGNVWNITDEFTTDNRFNNPGLIFPAGTNVACVKEADGTFKYDTMSGTVDLSNYYTKGESDGRYGAKSAVEANTAAIATKANQDDLTALAERTTNVEGKASANELNISTNATNLQNHMNNKNNPHGVTKAQIGLDKVENVAPYVLPVASTAAIGGVMAQAVGNLSTSSLFKESMIDTKNKKLYTPKPDWNATVGLPNEILNKPAIPPAQVNSDWNATSGVAQILNKPTIPTPIETISWETVSVKFQSRISGKFFGNSLYITYNPNNVRGLSIRVNRYSDFVMSIQELIDIGAILSMHLFLDIVRGEMDADTTITEFKNHGLIYTEMQTGGEFNVITKGLKETEILLRKDLIDPINADKIYTVKIR